MRDARMASRQSQVAAVATMLALVLEGCGGFFPEREWKVDVLNGDRPLIVSIATHRSASMWLIEPETHVVLYRQAEALAGSIELIEPTTCFLYDNAQLAPSSFTIVPKLFKGPPPDFELDLVPGATA